MNLLKFEVVWKDDRLFNRRVTADNGSFLGSTEIYTTEEAIAELSKQLENYLPDNDAVVFSAGHGGYKCLISIKYLEPSGRIIVNALIESEEPAYKNSVNLSLLSYPANLDNFQKELRVLSMLKEGTAILQGI